MTGRPADAPCNVVLRDGFWAPRVERLRDHGLPAMWGRLEAQGAFDNFRRLAQRHDGPRRALHFSDSDVYKLLETAALLGRSDLVEPTIELIEAIQRPDGYVHTFYGTKGAPARYTDLDFGHEHYCFGHLIEAAIAHQQVAGSDRFVDIARRVADHLCSVFGPGRDERTDAHPEVELALVRLGRATGINRYVDHAAWVVEARLARCGTSLADVGLSGHAVRALYLASGIAEVALATGAADWAAAAHRLFDEMVERHAYPTGAVGGRWLGEAIGKPYEQPDAMAYAESCAAVAATQFARRIWRLTGDLRALEQIELLLFNAVPCGVGADGDTWFYSQPQAAVDVAAESNLWAPGFDYGQQMALQWFPARRHDWFDVPCCPTNLGRLFASVDRHVAELDRRGDLLVHLPIACDIAAGDWKVTIDGRYPFDGEVGVLVKAAPPGRELHVRRALWAGGSGHETVSADASLSFPIDWQWWTTDPRVEGSGRTAYLRRGPVVHCLEGIDVEGIDLRDVVVDPRRSVEEAFYAQHREPGASLHRPVGSRRLRPIEAVPKPYCEWANRGITTMRIRFPQV